MKRGRELKKPIIFTDLDGTLLEHNNYKFDKAKPALELVKEKKIPLIICTSKTRAEIEDYRKKLKNKHPFISENGGAIFIPKNYFKDFNFKYSKKIKGYYVIEIGTPYEKLISVLKQIEKKTNSDIIGFHEMSLKDLVKDSGLSNTEAKLAMKREYDEPFKLIEPLNEKKKVFNLIKKHKLNYTEGGRYYHLHGNNDKGKALKILKKIYERFYKTKINSIALGDSQNDAPMLKMADTSFLVQKPNKSYERISSNKIRKIKGIGPIGWNIAITQLFLKLNYEKAEQLYKNSLEILKKFQLKNGAILASSPDGRYPYIYPRDHSICILALIDADEFVKAKKALTFILNAQNSDGSFPQRVTRNGRDASYKPIQLDNTALIIYAFARYIKKSKDNKFIKKYKSKINKSLKYLGKNLNEQKYLFYTPNSIHEFPPFEEGYEIWANSVCYGALKLLEDIKIISKIDKEKLKRKINKYLWGGKYFIKNIRVKESSSVAKEIDSSACALYDFEVFDSKNKKIKATVKEIEKQLTDLQLGGICRYKRHIGRNNGGYGPWPHFTLLICKYYINLGKKKQADKYLNWILDISYNLQLPEHISTKKDFEHWVRVYRKAGILRKDREIMIKNIRKSPMYKKGIAYSVLPLAWPHAEFIRTWKLYKDKFKNMNHLIDKGEINDIF